MVRFNQSVATRAGREDVLQAINWCAGSRELLGAEWELPHTGLHMEPFLSERSRNRILLAQHESTHMNMPMQGVSCSSRGHP